MKTKREIYITWYGKKNENKYLSSWLHGGGGVKKKFRLLFDYREVGCRTVLKNLHKLHNFLHTLLDVFVNPSAFWSCELFLNACRSNNFFLNFKTGGSSEVLKKCMQNNRWTHFFKSTKNWFLSLWSCKKWWISVLTAFSTTEKDKMRFWPNLEKKCLPFDTL